MQVWVTGFCGSLYHTICTKSPQFYWFGCCFFLFCKKIGKSKIGYLLNCWCVRTNPSSRIGNLTSQLPTMFCILKSRNFAGKPSFCTTRAYFLAANLDCSSLQNDVTEMTISAKIHCRQAEHCPVKNCYHNL